LTRRVFPPHTIPGMTNATITMTTTIITRPRGDIG